jgi:Zn-dependent oligopeptidase
MNASNLSQNPLLKKTKNLPWREVKVEHFVPALKQAVADFKTRFETIVSANTEPTFENTILEIDFAEGTLSRILHVYNVHSLYLLTDEVTAIQNEMNEIESDYDHFVMTNRQYFERVEKIFKGLDRTTEEYQITKTLYDRFMEHGIHLSLKAQEELAQIYKRMGELSNDFANQALVQKNAIRVKVTDPKWLEGLNAQSMQTLNETRDANGAVWVAVKNASLVTDILENGTSEKLRKQVYYAGAVKKVAKNYISAEEAGKAWEVDNEPILIEIINLRIRLAKLLGHKNYAQVALKDRMASTIEAVDRFYGELVPGVLKLAEEENKELLAFAQTFDSSMNKVQPWNRPFYVTKLEKQRYQIDQEELREYFEANHSVQSVLDFYAGLFEIRFERDDSIESYHDDVVTYRIIDGPSGNFLSELHLDLYSRPIKKGGAWKMSFQKAGLTPEGRQTSVMGIALNIDRAPEGMPTLLRLSEVNTLFHEFGHGMHEAFSAVKYLPLAGTNVARDFVEFPSQIMENWLYTPEFLQKGAIHYQTKQPLPLDWIQKINDSKEFRAGNFIMRQATLGLTDFKWHVLEEEISDVKQDYVDEFEQKIYETYSFPIEGEFSPMSPKFSHIFAGGYAMGYYSYLWANMIEADGFDYWYEDKSKIKEKARRLKAVLLSQGGARDGNTLYREWTARDYSPKSFLKRSGLKV